MLRSLSAGVSGLRNHQVRMDVIGNNISNVNTVAYKASRVQFREGFAQLLQVASRPPADQGGINPQQVGLGMQIGSIDQLFSQGNLENTGLTTDLAIQGDAFFVVRKSNQNYFTRAGNFQLDSNGQLVSLANGYIVQGRMFQDGVLQDNVRDIQLPFGQRVSAKQTTTSRLSGNLNAAAPNFVGSIDNPADRALGTNAASWTEAQIGVFDSQGGKHNIKIQLWKTGTNSWDWRIDPHSSASVERVTTSASSPPAPFTLPVAPAGFEIDPANVKVKSLSGVEYDSPGDFTVAAGPPPAVNFTASMPSNATVNVSYFMSPTAPAAGENSGTFEFDDSGLLLPGDGATVRFAVAGAGPLEVNLDLDGGVNGLTQFASTASSASTAVLRDQDGYTSGTLQNFSIDRSGMITGFFTNGTTSSLARIVLADFNNPSGLLRVGDNMFQESANSGGAVLGMALEGSQSSIAAGALEMSNVDLAQEFTGMIVAQRGFQANGKVVSTADEMLQEMMQLKR
jgi:flagellar hook protein FlgE